MVKTQGTGGELKLRALIEKEGYEHEDNKSFPPYEVDVYVPEFHLAFEFDGRPYHSFKSRDRRRDEHLMKIYGLPICRIRHFGLGIIADIRSFVNLWTADGSVKERLNTMEGNIDGTN